MQSQNRTQRRGRLGLAAFALFGIGFGPAAPVGAQVPLGIMTARGQSVTPVYEGWYRNADGTRTLSFGYFNRNGEEVMEIPVGAENKLEPAQFDGQQPTAFYPRRHWGVFGIRVPADFDGTIVWTLLNRGTTFSIPGALKRDWEIDALAGEAGSGNTPPLLAFAESGPWVAGPGGLHGTPLQAQVNTPVSVTVWTKDDGRPSTSVVRIGQPAVPVTLTWFKFSGPGAVDFTETSAEIPVTGGAMTTAAAFSKPGKYLIRVRANDASGVTSAGHSQCCWTNGFVEVVVRD